MCVSPAIQLTSKEEKWGKKVKKQTKKKPETINCQKQTHKKVKIVNINPTTDVEAKHVLLNCRYIKRQNSSWSGRGGPKGLERAAHCGAQRGFKNT